MARLEYAYTIGKSIGEYSMQALASGSKDTLGEAIGAIAHDHAYYTIVCGYETVGEIEPRCAVCHGEGQVPRKRTGRLYAMKQCPECKGKPAGETIPVRFPVLSETTLCAARQWCLSGS